MQGQGSGTMTEIDNSSRQINAASLLLSHGLLTCCISEWISEEALRKIIELHGLTPNSNNNHHYVSDYLFFRMACCNKKSTVGIIRCLLEYFPTAASAVDDEGLLPLHHACRYGPNNQTLGVIQLLIDAAPDSVRCVSNDGHLPLHSLCTNEKIDETTATDILKLLLERHPESIRHANSAKDEGLLPIHVAAMMSKSPQFCRVLIETYPGSQQMADQVGMLPLHYACMNNTIMTIKYLYKLYPDAINHETTHGLYPIHNAIVNFNDRDNPRHVTDIVKFLLGCDHRVKLQKFKGTWPLLCFVCLTDYDYAKVGTALEIIKIIYDANPQAIESDEMISLIASNFEESHSQVREFIISQVVYSRQAKDRLLMTIPDDNLQLPLHTALQNNVRLGSIKLLVGGFPLAVQSPDNSGALPLHVACMNHESASVVQYLVELDRSTLDAVDDDNNTALHYACRGAKYETIALLLGKYDAVSVSRRNVQKKLPIDLLWESNEVVDRECVEYTEVFFQLVKAYPETVINWM